MYVRDLVGNEYLLEATTEWQGERNGNQSIAFTIEPSKVNELFIDNLTEMWNVIDDDGVEYKVVYVKKAGEGDKLIASVIAVPLFFDVFDNDRIYEEYNTHMTAHDAFTLIFADTGFNFVIVDAFTAVQWQGFGKGDTKLATFKRALERYKAEFRISGKIVYLESQIGRDTSFQYRYRLNASNIIEEIDATALWTYAKGFGDYEEGDEENAALTREYTSPIADIVGIRHAPPIYDGRVTDETTMDNALKTLVNESLKISVSADIHDLRRQGYALAQPELGDRVFLIDERIGLDVEVRVSDITVVKDWRGNVIDLKLTLGSDSLTKRHQSNLTSAIGRINDLIEGRTELPFSALDEAVRAATLALQSAQTELEFNNGIIGRDPNNPNKLTVFTSAGIGISNDGGNSFRTAVTGDGIVADVITAGTLRGIVIEGVEIYGSTFRSISGADEMTITGGNIHLLQSNGRYVEMSPSGFYGRNAGGDIRFQADSTLVTSSAFGTSQTNVYLASRSGEARVVEYDDIPGDGLIGSYRYLPLRASGFYGNFWNINTGTGASAVNLYARPLSAGELRVTLNGTTDIYQPIRVESVKANTYDVNNLSGASDNLFLRPNATGEVRAVNNSGTSTYVAYRGLGYYGDFIDKGTGDGVDFFIRPAGGGEVKVTVRGTETTYRPVRAREFITDTSVRENKRNIDVYDIDVLDIIRNADAYLYNRVNEGSHTKKQLGLMLDEMPYETYSERGDGFGIYGLVGFLFRGLKQAIEKIDALEGAMK